MLAAFDGDAIGFRLRHAAELQQVLEVAVAHALPFGDRGVHQRLRERGLVALVVTVTAVTVHVDHHVAQERVAEIHGQAHDLRDGLWILTVYVKNRNLEHLRDVGRVGRRATLRGRRGEADLIVDHDVQRAARGVRIQLAEVQRLLDDAFTGERGVTVDEQAELVGVRGVTHAVLLGAHATQDHRIDVFQMARVEAQREVHLLAALGHEVRAVAQVVLHVAAAEVQLRIAVLDLAEDLARALTHHVGEHVQATAVGHAQDNLVDAVLCCAVDGQREQRNQALRAREREGLHGREFLAQELLERGRVGQLGKDADLLRALQLEAVLRTLHPIL